MYSKLWRFVLCYFSLIGVNQSMADVDIVHNIMSIIHSQQHPPGSTCKNRRLLVTQFDPKSFEGIGSILRIVYLGLGEAAHSNRTLIWGLDLPFLFERTRSLWDFRENTAKDNNLEKKYISVNGIELNCDGWKGHGGGPYGCFFLPLSTCSLADVTYNELHHLSSNGFDDTSRVKIQDPGNRGPASYHPPYNTYPFDKLFSTLLSTNRRISRMSNPRQKWTAAITAYCFRLKPKLWEVFESRRLALYQRNNLTAQVDQPVYPGFSIGDTSFEGMTAYKYSTQKSLVWGMHVRHGDVAALIEYYKNRRAFSFQDFFLALMNKVNATFLERRDNSKKNSCGQSCEMKATQLLDGNELPDAIFVASDNPNTSALIQQVIQSHHVFDSWPRNSSKPSPPLVFTTDSHYERFKTDHGSHTVAADGGCLLQACALPYETILEYKAKLAGEGDQTSGDDVDVDTSSKEYRMMRVLLESIEDLFLLSKSEVLLTQMSSHYSTFAALLSWAHTGARDVDSVVYLDIEGVTDGSLGCGMIHGGANLTEIPFGRGIERWIRLSHKFYPGLPTDEIDSKFNIRRTLTVSQDRLMRLGTACAANISHACSSDAMSDTQSLVVYSLTRDVGESPTWSSLLRFRPEDDLFRIRLKDNLPCVPEIPLQLEVRRWLGVDASPVWPGECPMKFTYGDSVSNYVIDLINLGSDHHRFHPNQAVLCWTNALRVLKKSKKEFGSKYEDTKEVLDGNMLSLSQTKMFPYSMGKEKTDIFFTLQLGLPVDAIHPKKF